MPCNFKLRQNESLIPKTLIKSYKIIGTNCEGKEVVIEIHNSHQRFVRHHVDWKICKIEFIPLETYGCEEFRVFRFEVEGVM